MRNKLMTWKPTANSEQNTLRQQRRARMLERLSPHGATPTLHCMASLPDASKSKPFGNLVCLRSKLFYLLLAFYLLLLTFSLVSCDYGKLGGADMTTTYDSPRDIEGIIGRFSGVWYSHYGTRKLDSYRVSRWSDRHSIMPPDKQTLFQSFDIDAPEFREVVANISDDDYLIFYDDTVFQSSEGAAPNGSWGFCYAGIVRAVNIFNGDFDTGAIIIEYLDGAYPKWSNEVLNTPLPFFGVYYRVLKPDVVQMANAVDLAALMAGQTYHTETATLEEAIAKNNAWNDSEFISWGIVIPQDRE